VYEYLYYQNTRSQDMVTTRSQRRKQEEKDGKRKRMGSSTILVIYVCMLILTIQAFRDLRPNCTSFYIFSSRRVNSYIFPADISIRLVWSFAWITAVSTGIGSVPFFLTGKIDDVWLGLSNSFAAGMMLAASFNLVKEAMYVTENAEEMEYITTHGLYGAVAGCIFGCMFMYFAKSYLEKYEDLHIYDIEGSSARRMLLIVFVMTVHSFSEGIAIGVAFAGKSGFKLGTVTSTSLAVHNIPEGLAVSLALVPNGIAPSVAGLWSVLSR
jgi:zinc transporter, ZIP family